MPFRAEASGPTPLTIWVPQSYAESAQPFWAAIAVGQVDRSGAPARPVGETTPDGRVWVSVHLAGLVADGTAYDVPAEGGAAIAATLRVLPRGAGVCDLHRAANKKTDPANIVALIIALLLAAYYLVFR